MKKRKQFPIYLDWEKSIKLLEPKDAKDMLLMLFEFYAEGVEPQPESPMLKMFFSDKLQYMKKLENDRIKKLQEYQGDSPRLSKSPRVSREAVNVDVEVPVDVQVEVPVKDLVSPPVSVPVIVDEDIKTELTESERKAIEFDKLFASV